MQKKFEINRTKIEGGCQSGRKVVTHNSKNDLPLSLKNFIVFPILKKNVYFFSGCPPEVDEWQAYRRNLDPRNLYEHFVKSFVNGLGRSWRNYLLIFQEKSQSSIPSENSATPAILLFNWKINRFIPPTIHRWLWFPLYYHILNPIPPYCANLKSLPDRPYHFPHIDERQCWVNYR